MNKLLLLFCIILSQVLYANTTETDSISLLQKDFKYKIANNRNKNNLIASWNIRDLGRSKNDEEILVISKIINQFDFISLQEIVGKDPAGIKAVAKIIDNLNRMGSKWDYSVSDPTKSLSSNMSERYAFLWKTSKVKLINRPYLDKELENLCYREPYIGLFKFKSTGKTVHIINYHSRKHFDKPEEEIIYLNNYKQRLKTNHIIICGDFNTNEKHTVWNSFYKKGYKNALSNTATTLKAKCKYGNYLNHSIDNFYYSPALTVIKSGRIDFVEDCKNLSVSRLISDHLPIFIEVQ